MDHDNTNYFWTNHALGIATAINVCHVMSNAFDMLEKELDEVIRDSENEKQNPRPRPITVSDLINCIRAIGKIDVKMIRTYNFAIPKKPELKPEPELQEIISQSYYKQTYLYRFPLRLKL